MGTIYAVDDTIAAIASASGGAARGIIRVSGPNTLECVERCFHSSSDLDLRVATSASGHLTIGSSLPPIGARLYLWPTTRSFTAQPTAEFHTLGSPPLLESAIRRICETNVRLAEPGEFTLRAFLAGRIDLPQAEAVLGVINANSERQLSAALNQLSGGLSGPLNELRDRMLNLVADLEAGLDFVDEDIEFVTAEQLANELHVAMKQIAALREQLDSRSDSQQVPRIVLIGRPNVGKSTLWNAMRAEHQMDSTTGSHTPAIVSDIPGTTRDVLSARVLIHGQACELIDTAGIDSDLFGNLANIDSAAQAMAKATDTESDITLLCLESGTRLHDWERQQLETLSPSATIIVATKMDAGVSKIDLGQHREFKVVATSAQLGRGLDELRNAISMILNSDAATEGRALASTATRCRDSLRMAFESIERSIELHAIAAGEELIAAEVRLALNELGKVAGSVYTDDVLDRIFSRFCIGK